MLPRHAALAARARRILGRARGWALTARTVAVRQHGPGAVRVSRLRGGWRHFRLDDPSAGCRLATQAVTVAVSDPAGLARLAASGLLTGQVRRLTVRVAVAPDWLLNGVRPPRLGRTVVAFTWRRRAGGLRLRLRWSQPHEVHRALRAAAAAVLRQRPLPQSSGHESTVGSDGVPTAAANPIGRTLVGAAARYRLLPGAESLVPQGSDGRADGRPPVRLDGPGGVAAAVARGELTKYAVVEVDAHGGDAAAVDELRTLAACGVVFASADETVRARLTDAGLVVVREPAEVNDLRGYALSVAASRRAAIHGDPVLRRTALAPGGALPAPAVSVVVSSKRPHDIEACLGYLAGQTYPTWEVVLGLHGYDVSESTRDRWRSLVTAPLRVLSLPVDLTFGAVLGRLSRVADGELLTKVDDDDRYGAQHLTDLVVAWHTSGADVAAKGSRFVYFPEAEETIDRGWTAPELFGVTPAGGTMLFSRGTLAEVGGWSHAPRHVDTDLLARVRAAGGVVFRTHGLEYVYVRRSAGHTWHTDLDDLRAQGERVYPGLPEGILAPDYAPSSPAYSAK
jgi:hypothetical protein